MGWDTTANWNFGIICARDTSREEGTVKKFTTYLVRVPRSQTLLGGPQYRSNPEPHLTRDRLPAAP